MITGTQLRAFILGSLQACLNSHFCMRGSLRLICYLFVVISICGCRRAVEHEEFALIQIQDRNGLTETISNPDRLPSYQAIDFLSSQPYKKVLRVFKKEGKNRSVITTYHPNGTLCQYLEAEEMRAHGAYREWFANGQLKIEATVAAGTADLSPGAQEDWIFDSLNKVWDEQGNLIASIPYEKGMLEGKSIYYYPSGQVEKELVFAKNRLEGEQLEYWPNGAVKSTGHYKNGTKEGASRSFFSDGKMAALESYSEGRIRSASYYTPSGDLISKIENGGGFQALFDDRGMTLIEHRVGLPDGLVQKFTPSSEIHRSYYLKSGKKQGEEVEYFLSDELSEKKEKPSPKLAVQWHENMIHGTVKTWYGNGQLQSQRQFSRNQRSGPSLAWYPDGSLMLYEEYEEGRLLNGQYYKIQKKEPSSSVIQGNGMATLYDETGSVLRKIHYLKGKPVDPEE